ncbi:hypothetical protein [Streptomyces bobili]|uniref:hypothetical protein n=1 Tax=Streptomyces bobili TaxID=67280 RepID=UPI0037207F90
MVYARAAIHREALAGELDRASGECDATSERDGDRQTYTLLSDADDAVFRGSAREVEGLFTPSPWSSSAATFEHHGFCVRDLDLIEAQDAD